MLILISFFLMFSVAPYAERYLWLLNDKEAQCRYFEAGTRLWYFGVMLKILTPSSV
jgi:hypothetical protein